MNLDEIIVQQTVESSCVCWLDVVRERKKKWEKE